MKASAEGKAQARNEDQALSLCLDRLSALVQATLALYEPENPMSGQVLPSPWRISGRIAIPESALARLSNIKGGESDADQLSWDGATYTVRAIEIPVQSFHRFFLYVVSTAPLDEGWMAALKELVMPALLGVVLARDMSALQKSMRYQIIWAECVEWLKTLKDLSILFSEELLRRLSLIADAPVACMLIDPDGCQEDDPTNASLLDDSKVLARNLSGPLARTLCLRLCRLVREDRSGIRTLSVTDLLTDEELGALVDGDQVLSTCHTVAVVPIRVRDRCEALLMLFLTAYRLDVFTQVYIEQLLSQISGTLEKERLVAELEHSLAQEQQQREAQSRLIEKLSSARQQLVQSEKMASIGQLAAGVAHEINNPIGYVNSNLNTLKGYVGQLFGLIEALKGVILSGPAAQPMTEWDELARQYDLAFLQDDVPALLNESIDGLERVKTIVQNLRDFSHVGDVQMQRSRLDELLEKTLSILHNELKYKCRIDKVFEPVEPIECMPTQLSQVFMNLLVNASDAIETQGVISIRLWQEDNMARIQIRDNGCGIPPEHMDKLFDPFFTTKPVGKGTGLGLSISYGIIRKHQGRMEFSSAPGQGTTVDIVLPLKQYAGNGVTHEA